MRPREGASEGLSTGAPRAAAGYGEMSMGFYNRSLMDYDGEKASVRVNTLDLTEANVATQITLQANFGAAINDMVFGTLQSIKYGNGVTLSNPAPENVYAQRELKWAVHFRDTVTGVRYHFTVPTANPVLLDPNNRKYAEIGDAGPVDAFVAATNAYVRSVAGNPVEVESIELVGRTL